MRGRRFHGPISTLIWAVAIASGCGCGCGPSPTPPRSEARAPPFQAAPAGLVVDVARGELQLAARFQKANAEEGTWHLLVHEGGNMAKLAFFVTEVKPTAFYEALHAIGAVDRNTVSSANFADESTATEGDELLFEVAWGSDGGETHATLQELLLEKVPASGPLARALGLEMRFGGNHTAEDAAFPPCCASGCLACLYSCSAGVTSNARANLFVQRRDGYHRYRLREGVGPPDGAKVTVRVRRREGP